MIEIASGTVDENTEGCRLMVDVYKSGGLLSIVDTDTVADELSENWR